VRTQIVTAVAGAAVAAVVVAPWAGVLVGLALIAAFRVDRARVLIALAPAALVGWIGLYVTFRQETHRFSAVFEWPVLFSKATTPAWAAIALFTADALYSWSGEDNAAPRSRPGFGSAKVSLLRASMARILRVGVPCLRAAAAHAARQGRGRYEAVPLSRPVTPARPGRVDVGSEHRLRHGHAPEHRVPVPMGPYYWLMQAVRLPDWVAQRLWLGSLVFFAGLGVLYLMRTLGVKGPASRRRTAYMFSPYSLDYASRISVLLMPGRARVDDRAHDQGLTRRPMALSRAVRARGATGRWVNATSLIFTGVAPVLDPVFVRHPAGHGAARARRHREDRWAHVAHSLWWMAGLWAQGSYGLDILKYTETVKAVSRTSTPNEVLRGLGYWFFYGQDSVGPWTEASINYTQHIVVIVAGYGLAGLALAGAAFARWRQRSFFLVMTFVGVSSRSARTRTTRRPRSAGCSRTSRTAPRPASRSAVPGGRSRSSLSAWRSSWVSA